MWYLQVCASFVVAIAFAVTTLADAALDTGNGGDDEGWASERGFQVVCSLFALSATLSLAKAVRDRTDAAAFLELDANLGGGPPSRADVLRALKVLVQGTAGNTVVAVSALAISASSAIFGAMQMEGVTLERSVAFTSLTVFMMYAASMLAKLIRDRQAGVPGNHAAYQFLVGAGFAVSVAATFGFVHSMGLSESQSQFLYTCLVFVLSSVLTVAKFVRDRQELGGVLRAG